MIHSSFGNFGAQIEPIVENGQDGVHAVKTLIEMIHGERPFTATQKRVGDAVLERVWNSIRETGRFTPAHFNLLYKTFR